MRKKAKRLLAFVLAVLMLIPIASVTATAGDAAGGTTSAPIISDVSDILNALTYAEYREKYAGYGKGSEDVSIDVADNVYVVNGEESVLELQPNYGEEGNKASGVVVPSTGIVSWSFDIPTTGNYIIEIEYCQTGDKTNSIERSIFANFLNPLTLYSFHLTSSSPITI